MNRLIRWYNQNREAVILLVIIIALVLAVIYTWNYILEQRIEENSINKSNVITNTNTSNTITSNTNTSIITGEEIKETTDKTNTSIIAEFVNYCNIGEIEQAYNMLSDECKELLYPSLEKFKTNYYENIFYIERAYNLEAWYVDYDGLSTYYITYTEDILSSGTTTSEDNRGDYITVVEGDNNNYHINISNYVGREEINESQISNNIIITINYFDMYIDYTMVNMTVKNNTEATICLDTKEETDTMYLYDENDVTYIAFLNEIADEQLAIISGGNTTLSIKFNKIYNPERYIDGIYFSDIVLNYEEYKNEYIYGKEVVDIDIEI